MFDDGKGKSPHLEALHGVLKEFYETQPKIVAPASDNDDSQYEEIRIDPNDHYVGLETNVSLVDQAYNTVINEFDERFPPSQLPQKDVDQTEPDVSQPETDLKSLLRSALTTSRDVEINYLKAFPKGPNAPPANAPNVQSALTKLSELQKEQQKRFSALIKTGIEAVTKVVDNQKPEHESKKALEQALNENTEAQVSTIEEIDKARVPGAKGVADEKLHAPAPPPRTPRTPRTPRSSIYESPVLQYEELLELQYEELLELQYEALGTESSAYEYDFTPQQLLQVAAKDFAKLKERLPLPVNDSLEQNMEVQHQPSEAIATKIGNLIEEYPFLNPEDGETINDPSAEDLTKAMEGIKWVIKETTALRRSLRYLDVVPNPENPVSNSENEYDEPLNVTPTGTVPSHVAGAKPPHSDDQGTEKNPTDPIYATVDGIAVVLQKRIEKELGTFREHEGWLNTRREGQDPAEIREVMRNVSDALTTLNGMVPWLKEQENADLDFPGNSGNEYVNDIQTMLSEQVEKKNKELTKLIQNWSFSPPEVPVRKRQSLPRPATPEYADKAEVAALKKAYAARGKLLESTEKRMLKNFGVTNAAIASEKASGYGIPPGLSPDNKAKLKTLLSESSRLKDDYAKLGEKHPWLNGEVKSKNKSKNKSENKTEGAMVLQTHYNIAREQLSKISAQDFKAHKGSVFGPPIDLRQSRASADGTAQRGENKRQSDGAIRNKTYAATSQAPRSVLGGSKGRKTGSATTRSSSQRMSNIGGPRSSDQRKNNTTGSMLGSEHSKIVDALTDEDYRALQNKLDIASETANKAGAQPHAVSNEWSNQVNKLKAKISATQARLASDRQPGLSNQDKRKIFFALTHEVTDRLTEANKIAEEVKKTLAGDQPTINTKNSSASASVVSRKLSASETRPPLSLADYKAEMVQLSIDVSIPPPKTQAQLKSYTKKESDGVITATLCSDYARLSQAADLSCTEAHTFQMKVVNNGIKKSVGVKLDKSSLAYATSNNPDIWESSIRAEVSMAVQTAKNSGIKNPKVRIGFQGKRLKGLDAPQILEMYARYATAAVYAGGRPDIQWDVLAGALAQAVPAYTDSSQMISDFSKALSAVKFTQGAPETPHSKKTSSINNGFQNTLTIREICQTENYGNMYEKLLDGLPGDPKEFPLEAIVQAKLPAAALQENIEKICSGLLGAAKRKNKVLAIPANVNRLYAKINIALRKEKVDSLPSVHVLFRGIKKRIADGAQLENYSETDTASTAGTKAALATSREFRTSTLPIGRRHSFPNMRLSDDDNKTAKRRSSSSGPKS